MFHVTKKRKIKPETREIDVESDDMSVVSAEDFFGSGSFDKLIKVRNNHIYFYDQVNKKNVLQLIDEVQTLASSVKSKSDSIDIEKPCIYLHINSDGGCVYSALSALDTLSSLDIKLVTIAEGHICSAATMIYLAGEERWMRKHTYTLIHQIRTFSGWVTHKEMVDEMDTTNELQNMLVELYKEHTNIPKKKLDSLMSHEIQMNSATCLKYNFCHKLI